MELIRLQKYLADAGIASRRKCEEYILDKRVKVNGEVITALGTKIDPASDIISFDEKVIDNKPKKIYVLLNKPIGYVTTVKDQFSRQTVLDLIKIKERIVPVGRLDMYTSGALILSNDGDFINKIAHPKHEIDKTYNVTVKGIIKSDEIKKLENGIKIEEYTTKPAKVKILKINEEENISRFSITIHEGKNRQVRKMCKEINKKVLALHRARIGNIEVKDLPLGKWRYLKKEEVEELLKK